MAGTNASASDPNIATGKAVGANIRRKKKSSPAIRPLRRRAPDPILAPMTDPQASGGHAQRPQKGCSIQPHFCLKLPHFSPKTPQRRPISSPALGVNGAEWRKMMQPFKQGAPGAPPGASERRGGR